MSAVMNSLRFILDHPLTKDDRLSALERLIKWQVASRIRPRSIMIHNFVNGSKLAVRRGQHSVTANIYVGLSEFEAMGFTLHLLREGDCFVDIGANVGVYTVLASAVKKARTIAIEPIPSTFKCLMENIYTNCIQDRVSALNIGIGSKNESLPFTTGLGSMNRVAKDGGCAKTVFIDVRPLDSVLDGSKPVMIKIDTEGYVEEIFNGADKTFSNPGLKAVVIEINSDMRIHAILSKHGFKPAGYDPFSRSLTEKLVCDKDTEIYVRDFEFARDRVRSSEKFKVLNKYL